MAQSRNTGKKTSSQRTRSNSNSKSSSSRQRSSYNSGNARRANNSNPMDENLKNEIILIALLAVCVLLFLCNFHLIGAAGNAISGFLFGLFGLCSYVMPIVLFVAVLFGLSNKGNFIATRKLVAGICLVLLFMIVMDLLLGDYTDGAKLQIADIYSRCKDSRNGGGIIGGIFAFLLFHFMGKVGTIIASIVIGIICVVVLTDRSFLTGLKKGSQKVYEKGREESINIRERNERRRRERAEYLEELEKEEALLREAYEDEKTLRMDKKVSGVMLDTSLAEGDNKKTKTKNSTNKVKEEAFYDEADESESNYSDTGMSDIHEIMPDVSEAFSPELWEKLQSNKISPVVATPNIEPPKFEDIRPVESDLNLKPLEPEWPTEPVKPVEPVRVEEPVTYTETAWPVSPVEREKPAKPVAKVVQKTPTEEIAAKSGLEVNKQAVKKEYVFPPIELLKAGKSKADNGKGDDELVQIASKLQNTLEVFGVKAKVTDISKGPAVTRFELQPEPGVKVSKIVGLSDDIKLSLAATDIRIEAPIPGKAAVGIEVPNAENTMVSFRELIENNAYKDAVKKSKLSFAVGKDIGGNVVVTDIAKMPHVLIAGATGSGKSVCINTLIMSILYGAKPDEVKMILIDPKVVELSVYNGIPHLMIPVVTDPKKAAGALQWGVAEMTDRYRKFADFNVRKLGEYNEKVKALKDKGEGEGLEILPQIVIIVDELADLMMVASGDVEDSICRLAQLARAAGIHLVVATQRPSVDVITGLIKANMPSRISFAVSSGTDSRTILDMVGAEKLLGKGDMLFYPQGYTKPARVQGAFVSDDEVEKVVDFLKQQSVGNVYNMDAIDKIDNMKSSSPQGGGDSASAESSFDQYFVEAGKFIIDKNKASIGMLQRVFKIGFNRAARIMDQLCEAGVVGEEEGTKPRKILMSMSEFEAFIEESGDL